MAARFPLIILTRTKTLQYTSFRHFVDDFGKKLRRFAGNIRGKKKTISEGAWSLDLFNSRNSRWAGRKIIKGVQIWRSCDKNYL